MILTDEVSLATTLAEARQLRVVYRLLEEARRESLHPVLGGIDVPDLDDAFARLAQEIDEREDAVSRFLAAETETAAARPWSHGLSAGRTF